METLRIRYGGSNRKLAQHLASLRMVFGASFRDMGSLGCTGHHSNHDGYIPDTVENRDRVKAIDGVRIAKHQ